MEVLHPHCAGLEVHKDSVVACVRQMVDGDVKREVRSFKTTTKELMALSEWLSLEGCTHLVMEATGVYWKPVWHILADGAFELLLANAAHVKNVPGRKTRRQRCHLVGRTAGARAGPREFCAGSANPGDAQPVAQP
jgi:transposase